MRTSRSFFITILTILATLLLAGTAAKADLTDGLVAHWKFDEDTGSTAYDSAGTNDGTLFGDTAWVTGQIGSALDFDGDGDYVDVGTMGNFGSSIDEVTISAWVKSGTTDEIMSILGLDNTGLGTTQLKVRINFDRYWGTTEGTLHVYVRDEDNEHMSAYVESNTGVVDGDWHHIGVVIHKSLGSVAVYVDGITHTIYYKSQNTGTNFADFNNSMYLGAFNIGTGDLQPFNGSIDDVRIYDRALSAEEIEQLYAGEPNPVDVAIDQIQQALIEKVEALDIIENALEKEEAAIDTLEEILESGEYGDLKKADIVKAKQKIHSATQHQDQATHQIDRSIEKLKDASKALGLGPPVSHWKFDEGTGSTAYDSAGDNDGTLTGDTSWVGGKIGSFALSFDGDGDYVNVPNHESQQINTDEITIAAWIKLSDDVGVVQQRIVCKQEINQNTWALLVVGEGAGGGTITGNQVIFTDSDGQSAYVNCISPTQLNAQQWYHVVATDEGGTIKIYIDGNLSCSCDNGYGVPPDIDAPITIGNKTTGQNRFYFNGSIDDVRIYSRTLSAVEVVLLYCNLLE